MDLSKFTSAKTGQLHPISGVPNVSHYFLPDALPPTWAMSTQLWRLVAEARAAIGSLNGIGKHLPNPQLLLSPLQHREAQLSSQLEGTITNPQQQLLFEMDLQPPNMGTEELAAFREVSNYRKALRYHFDQQDKLPISLRLIRELHRVLLKNVRGSTDDPGKFRRIQVQIGRPARYVPPPPHQIKPLLNNLENYIHTETDHDPLVDAFLVHYQFEAIHPFRDGNGRVGRLLLAIMIAEGCGLTHNWLYMSAFFDAHKDEYIDRLFNVSAKGDWEGWMAFCLRGALQQARDTEFRCDKLLEIATHFKEKIKATGGSYRLQPIVDDLFVIPVVQVPTIADKFQVSYPTAKADIDKLIELNILQELSDGRPKSYYCQEIFQLIYDEFS